MPFSITPTNLLTLLLMGLFRLLILLPLAWQQRLGRGLGRLALRLARRRREIAATNLALCFPERTEAERAVLLRRHFESLGIAMFEIALAWWAPPERLRRWVQIEGLEHLQAARQAGGVIMLSAHFTTLEIGGRMLGLFSPFHMMYRQHENPVVEYFMGGARRRYFETAIPRDNVRAMIKSLAAGHAVWYAVDQNYGKRNSVFVPFFGVPAATFRGPALFALRAGAPIFIGTCIREPGWPQRYRAWTERIHFVPSGDLEADVVRLTEAHTAALEKAVRQAPEQYFWQHKRWKTRPPQEPPTLPPV